MRAGGSFDPFEIPYGKGCDELDPEILRIVGLSQKRIAKVLGTCDLWGARGRRRCGRVRPFFAPARARHPLAWAPCGVRPPRFRLQAS